MSKSTKPTRNSIYATLDVLIAVAPQSAVLNCNPAVFEELLCLDRYCATGVNTGFIDGIQVVKVQDQDDVLLGEMMSIMSAR